MAYPELRYIKARTTAETIIITAVEYCIFSFVSGVITAVFFDYTAKINQYYATGKYMCPALQGEDQRLGSVGRRCAAAKASFTAYDVFVIVSPESVQVWP